MKVLLLCTKVPVPANDGGSLAILAFARILKIAGLDVTILAANTPKHYQKDIPPDFNGILIKAFPINTDVKWYNAIVNLLFCSLPFNVTRFKNRQFAAMLAKMLQNDAFDIIQLEGPHMGIYLPVIKKNSKAKVVLRAHNVEHVLWREITNGTKPILKRLYLQNMVHRLQNFEIELISKVDGVVAISESDSSIIRKISHPKFVEVIPFGVDISDYNKNKLPQENSIFFIGALDWIPNQEGLIWFLDSVWPLLRLKLPHVTFHVAGRNVTLNLKTRMAAQNVYFYGEVPNAVVFMEQFQIQIVPLFSGSGVRVKIVEGMAMGKAIVTTSKGAEGINAEDGTHLLIADTPEAFVNSISELMNDRSKLNFLEENARVFISKEFDNLALSKKVENFYQRLA